MAALIAKYNPVGYYNGHDHTQSFQYVPEPTVTGDTNITNGYKYTGALACWRSGCPAFDPNRLSSKST